jgi:hypothetical protein
MGMEKRRPILSVRPKFDAGLTVVEALIVTLGGFIITTIFFGTFFLILFSVLGLGRHISAGGIYSFFFGVSLLGIPPLYYEVKKRAFQRTIYNFYDDYMDFQYFHWHINRRRGRVRYGEIRDIAQHASALQEHQRLITIFLYVPGMAMGRRGGFSGVKLADLPQSKDYMTKIMDIFEGRAAQVAAAQAAPAAPATQVAPPAQPPAAPVEASAAVPAAATPVQTPAPAPASPSSPPPVTEG